MKRTCLQAEEKIFRIKNDNPGKHTVIDADKLEYETVMIALEDGDFYASTGPEIYDFYVANGKVVIDCSPVAMVRLQSDAHPTKIRCDADGNMTHAEFKLGTWAGPYKYVRMSVIDKDGNTAWTNPIFLNN